MSTARCPGIHFAHLSLESGMVSRELHGVWTYLSFQFQMSKKERELREFEMDLNNLFFFALSSK